MATGLSRADGLSAAGGNYRGSDEQRGGGRKKKWVRIGAGGGAESTTPSALCLKLSHAHTHMCVYASVRHFPGLPSKNKHTPRAPPRQS